MSDRLLETIWEILACPQCGSALIPLRAGARCGSCGQEYPASRAGQLDLRPRQCKSYPIEFCIEPLLTGRTGGVPACHDAAEVDFSRIPLPRHLHPDLMRHFPKASRGGSLALDLGCGDTIHRRVCEHAGYGYVSLDVDGPDALILGDAHSLPFQDASFEFVLSVAVLEHIRYPFVMTREAWRVLKPGGKLVGSVAFLEPFHGDSFYHHSHLGTVNSLEAAGFEVQHLAPTPAWPALKAQASMGLFPKLPRPISHSLVLPVQLLHRLWWKAGHVLTRSRSASESYRRLATAGSFYFAARKPGGGD
jgi:SAM-dependent methyltransferase